MKRWMRGLCIVFGSITVTVAVLASAVAWGPHHCKAAFPMIVGCAVGSYESLAGGMIAAAAALIAGWLAWSAVQIQIEAEEKRSIADRVEVEQVLKGDIVYFAEGLSAIWKILNGFDQSADTEVNQRKLDGVMHGIGLITKQSWLSTSRRMVTELGWERRRSYEELFDGLERLERFQSITDSDVTDTLIAVKDLSYDFEMAQRDTGKYFEGLFRRPGKAWTLGYEIEVAAGLAG